MKNKKILIFGDSYSTYVGYNPNGYAVYYPQGAIPCVDDVSKTWWHMLEKETESHIVMNNSWSGSTVCNRRYGDEDCSNTNSFIHRLDLLIADGFFEKNEIDCVIVFGGTNDSWTGHPCGEPQYSDWTYGDKMVVLPGYSCFIDKLLSVVPKEIVCAVVNSELRADFTKGVADICEHYGIKRIQLENIDKINGHPTFKGMTAIKEQVVDALSGQ